MPHSPHPRPALRHGYQRSMACPKAERSSWHPSLRERNRVGGSFWNSWWELRIEGWALRQNGDCRSSLAWSGPGCTSCLRVMINNSSACVMNCPGLAHKYMVTMGQATLQETAVEGLSWPLQRRKMLSFIWDPISDVWCCWKNSSDPSQTLTSFIALSPCLVTIFHMSDLALVLPDSQSLMALTCDLLPAPQSSSPGGNTHKEASCFSRLWCWREKCKWQ